MRFTNRNRGRERERNNLIIKIESSNKNSIEIPVGNVLSAIQYVHN